MRILFYVIGFALISFGLLYHLAALATFNFLVPKDAGSAKVARDVSFGPDPRQKMDVYRPEGAGPFPVLVFVYGGSWDSGRRQNYDFAGRALAARGYLTYVIDYRLVPAAHYPDFVNDVADAAAEALRLSPKYGGDRRNLFLVGHSAGGYNVAQAALLPGLIESRGIDRAVLKAVACLAAPLDVRPLDFPATRAAMGRAPDIEATQPIHHVRRDAPNFLLLHGGRDKTVEPYNSVNLGKALKDAGAKAEVIIYEQLAHVDILLALSRPFRSRAPVLDDIDRAFKSTR